MVCVAHWVVEGVVRDKGSCCCLLTARNCACAAAPISRQQQAWEGMDYGELHSVSAVRESASLSERQDEDDPGTRSRALVQDLLNRTIGSSIGAKVGKLPISEAISSNSCL